MSALPKSVVELCQALVRIPSVNPDGEVDTEHSGEKACAEFVGEFLKQCGAHVVLEDVLPERPNVIGRFTSNSLPDGKTKPRIVFGPHTDTVGVAGMTIAPFGGEIRDGKIFGRGACDTKGPMAAMLWAMWELREEIADLPVEVHFCGFMSEETSQHGSRHFAQHHSADYAFAIVGEPTEMRTVFKHKGCLWADIETFGVAVHGSRPEAGENAIVKMAKLIKALDGPFRAQLASAGGEDEWLGRTTISLGMIRGGTRPNITADHCQLTVDIRYTPELVAAENQKSSDYTRPLALLQDFVKQHDATAKVSSRGATSPCLDTPSSNHFVQKLEKCGAALTGAPWFCDAAFLAASGLPAVAIGPGSIAQAHTKDEWIEVEALEKGAAFFVKWLRSL